MRKLLLILVVLLPGLAVFAQETRRITGIVVDEESSLTVIQAGVELLADKDSTRLEVTVTDMEGTFSLRALPGDYILKVSYIGCVTQYITIHQTISQEGVNVGTVILAREPVSLEAAVVSAKAEPVTVKEDTVIYNAAAFKVPEDADLDELLKKIPGLEVDGSGGVSLHGRPITQLLVNGKKYFGGDVKTGLKNIPAEMVENIKAYDRPTEQARLSGVDDGESEPVLDLTIKKSFMDGWQNSVNMGGGTSKRHFMRLNSNKITKTEQQTIVATSHNNVGKAAITTTNRNQVGTGGSGDAVFTNAGYTFSRDLPKVEMAGHFQYSSADREVESRSRSQSVQTTSSTFGNINAVRHNSAPTFKSDYSIEWRKDKWHTLFAKAVFQYDQTLGWSRSAGRSFNKDPYAYDPDPNSWIGFDVPGDPFGDIRVNSTLNTVNSATSKYIGYVTFLGTIRSHKSLRKALTMRLFVQLNGSDSDQAANYLTRYYRIKKNPDSLLVRSNYTTNDSRAFFTYGQLTYSNPISKKWAYQVAVRADYLRQRNSKEYYDLAAVDADWMPGQNLGFGEMKGSLPSGYETGFYDLFSAEGWYERVVLPVTVNVFSNTKKYNIVLGAVFREQFSTLHYNGGTTRLSSFDAAPNVSFKYRFSKTNQLSFVYRSWVQGPSLSSMIPITNGTNPLYISVGNPYLLSPIAHNSILNYNSSNKKKQSSVTGNISYNYTLNAVSTSTVYDEETGVRTSTPQNINGNWRATGSLAVTQTLPDNRFSLTNQTGGEFQNNVSYLYNSKLHKDETNVISRLMVKDRFEGCYRGDWLEVLLNGGVEYTDESSLLRPEMSQKPVSWVTGVSTQVSFPWKMRLETDFSTTFQRGWSYEELNKNYYILNAVLTQRMMKGRATVRLCWYDILRSQDNLTRSMSASSRSIVFFNGVSSYVMLRFYYRFKL